MVVHLIPSSKTVYTYHPYVCFEALNCAESACIDNSSNEEKGMKQTPQIAISGAKFA